MADINCSTEHSLDNRRQFLKTSAALLAVGQSGYRLAHAKPQATSATQDRPSIAQIGLGGMGTWDARGHLPFADHVAICDVDQSQIAKFLAGVEPIKALHPEVVSDYRRILDRQDVDLVSISTVDHWHVKIAVEALEAGKHVFCQKPLTLTLEENQVIRDACQRHPKLVFQVGTQQRDSKDLFLRAVNLVQKGLLGRIKRVVVGINGGAVGGPFPVTEPPQVLDWDFWQGPVAVHDYIHQRCHGTFRWWYDYSGGKFTDWGAHHVDIATWAIEQNGPGQGPMQIDGTDVHHPVEFREGYPTVDNSFNTANDFSVKCQFPDDIEMEITSRTDNGILFEGTKGRFFVNREKIVGKPIEENWDEGHFSEEDLVRLYKGKPHESHKENLFRCIAEGGLPVSDVFSHTQALNTCHLAAIAGRLGRVIKWDPKNEQILDDPQAESFFSREKRQGYDIQRG